MNKLIEGINDLQTCSPKIANEWHPTKNKLLTPKMIAVSSNKKVWWLGTCGHEWETSVIVRTKQGSNCPFCSGNRVLLGFNDIGTTDPAYLNEWDYDKNEIMPSEVTRGSVRLVWWICSKGHSYESRIEDRILRKRGCPYCANRKVLEGYNDLNTLYPELAKQWHPSKNGTLNPTDITPTSAKKVWWIGKCGHEWQSIPANRIRNIDGCPVCLNRIIIFGINDLETTDPELAKEWHPTKNNGLLPKNVTIGSVRKFWWLCSSGHEWQASPHSRANTKSKNNKYSRCPKCTNRSEYKPYQETLLESAPLLAKQWHPSKNNSHKPENYTPGSNYKAWWLGDCGHEWKAQIDARYRGASCPFCSGHKVLSGFNDLKTLYPQIAKEWDFSKNIKKPSDVSAGSHAKYWWLCEKGHSFLMSVNSRTRRNSICPICSANSTSFPEQFLYWALKQLSPDTKNRAIVDGYEYDIVVPSHSLYIEYSGAYWHKGKENRSLQKEKNIELKGGIYLEIIDDHGCKVKYGDIFAIRGTRIILDSNFEIVSSLHRILELIAEEYMHTTIKAVDFDKVKAYAIEYSKGKLENEKSLMHTHPSLAAEWDFDKNKDLSPDDISFGSKKKIWWLCPNGHSYQASPNRRTSMKVGCPYCSSKKVLPGFNDLESQLPHIAKEWHPIKNAGLKASQVLYGSSKKAWWLGKCGHEWQASISSRQSANCPFCGRRKLLAGFNDLNTTFPQLAKEWHPSKNDKLLPSDVMPMSSRKVWWLGPCGHEWQASISSRSNGANCPYCCNKAVLSGFNDLSFKCPELIEKWHYEMNDPLRPETLSMGSDRKVWWKCNNCSHVWKKTIRLMVKHRTCPICKR